MHTPVDIRISKINKFMIHAAFNTKFQQIIILIQASV